MEDKNSGSLKQLFDSIKNIPKPWNIIIAVVLIPVFLILAIVNIAGKVVKIKNGLE